MLGRLRRGRVLLVAHARRAHLPDSRPIARSWRTSAATWRVSKRQPQSSAEQANLDAVLRRPENAEVLERSVFLNALLYRKGISWTRIFADLEKIMPPNVRVMNIRPFVNEENQVTLDMTVGAEDPGSGHRFSQGARNIAAV